MRTTMALIAAVSGLFASAPRAHAEAYECECHCASSELSCIHYRLPDGMLACDWTYAPLMRTDAHRCAPMRTDALGMTAAFHPQGLQDAWQCQSLSGSACAGFADRDAADNGFLDPGTFYACHWNRV